MDHLLRAPQKHALFLSQVYVENIPKEGENEPSPRPARSNTAQAIADVLQDQSLMKERIELLKKAEEEKAAVEALKAADKSINLIKQKEHYERLRAESAEKGQLKGDQNMMENADITQKQEELQHYDAQKRAKDKNNAGDGFGDRLDDGNYPDTGWHASNHIYDDTPMFTTRHEGRGEAQDGISAGDGLGKHRDSYPTQHPLVPQDYEETKPPDQVKDALKGDYKYPHADHPPSRSQSSPQVSGKGNLKVGSPVQLPAVDGSIKYGTIRWIGLVPNLSEAVAGVEMVNNMSHKYSHDTFAYWFIL